MKTLKALLCTVAATLGLVIGAAPAGAYTVNAPSDTYHLCIMETQSANNYGFQPTAYCYSDPNVFNSRVLSYTNDAASLFGGTNYTGWQLELVNPYDFCNNSDLTVIDLTGTGWNNRISSSIVYGSGCVHGYAYDGPGWNNKLGEDFGYSNNQGMDPNWGTSSDKTTSLRLQHYTYAN